MGLFGSRKSSSNTSANQTTVDASANAAGASTITASQSSRVTFDNRVDESTRGNSAGTVRDGDGNTILGTGAMLSTSTTTYNVEDVTGDVVNRALESLDKGTDAAYGFSATTVDKSLAFGGRSLESADKAYAGGLGFGKDALEVVAQFGASTIQNANARADSALAAVERLAAVPADRAGSSAQDSRVTLFVVAGLALLALLLGGRRPAKTS